MKRFLAMLAIVLCMIPSIVVAHSGGTDSSGGHHDYNNVSGLGSYHYHHGYGPHLHENGICPYDNTSSSSSDVVKINSSNTETLPQQAERLAKIFGYVDGDKYDKIVEQNKKLKYQNEQLEGSVKTHKYAIVIIIVISLIIVYYMYRRGNVLYESGVEDGEKKIK